jgi:serine/threonine protein kinase
MSPHPSVPPGTLLGGKFRIDRLLGSGAMGTVYAIDHELTRHKHALKLLHPASQHNPDIVRRFLNEASAAGRAGNPHLVETFDAGTLPTGEPYVVMELLEGETLGAVIDRDHALDPSLTAELVAQAAEGMDAAHRAGIIHRDLKPENLFVTTRDGRPFIKIMDFGVSKFEAGASVGMRGTQAGMVYGSPVYMSPEQLTARIPVDARTDVFALGVVLFQCLTGALPFDAPTLEALAVRILAGEPASMESLRPGLPPDLMAIVRKAIAPHRDERFASARALADALTPFRRPSARLAIAELSLADTLMSAPPPMAQPASLPPSLPPGVARRPLARWLVIGALGLLVAGLTAVLLARSAPSEISSAGPPRVVGPPSQSAPESPRAAAVPSAESPASPVIETTARPVASQRPPAAPVLAAVAPGAAPSVSPSAAGGATARPSAAHDLGLREDNPFR